jgi:hypothetical protein
MTFLQPKNHLHITNIIIAALVLVVLGGTVGLIVEYNKTVTLQHNILAVKTQLQSIGAANTQLTNSVFATLDNGQAPAIAAADGLVADNNPQYYTVNPQWPIASQ